MQHPNRTRDGGAGAPNDARATRCSCQPGGSLGLFEPGLRVGCSGETWKSVFCKLAGVFFFRTETLPTTPAPPLPATTANPRVSCEAQEQEHERKLAHQGVRSVTRKSHSVSHLWGERSQISHVCCGCANFAHFCPAFFALGPCACLARGRSSPRRLASCMRVARMMRPQRYSGRTSTSRFGQARCCLFF